MISGRKHGGFEPTDLYRSITRGRFFLSVIKIPLDNRNNPRRFMAGLINRCLTWYVGWPMHYRVQENQQTVTKINLWFPYNPQLSGLLTPSTSPVSVCLHPDRSTRPRYLNPYGAHGNPAIRWIPNSCLGNIQLSFAASGSSMELMNPWNSDL